jgi:peptidoglycan/xylan/chitin deacetylase (PgdA/CDA1 family)
MRIGGAPRILAALAWLLGGTSLSYGGKCLNPKAIGISRVIQVGLPANAKPVSLKKGKYIKLKRKELILTIDDGPHPKYTPLILKALDEQCIKATFFMVGEMAQQSPELVREVYRRGHTVATHTWGHPRSLPKLNEAVAIAEIERGIEAVSYALGKEPGGPSPAPLFRFPGLNGSTKLISYLQKKGISAVTVDIDPRDWEQKDADKLYKQALKKIRRGGRGVLLIHDIKAATAKMLPRLLVTLKKRGYTFAHMVPAAPAKPPLLLAKAKAAPEPLIKVSFASIGLRPSILAEETLLRDDGTGTGQSGPYSPRSELVHNPI